MKSKRLEFLQKHAAVLFDLHRQLDGECSDTTCPKNISYMQLQGQIGGGRTQWHCSDCVTLFEPQYDLDDMFMSYNEQACMLTRVDNPCPCTLLGEEAVEYLGQVVNELREVI